MFNVISVGFFLVISSLIYIFLIFGSSILWFSSLYNVFSDYFIFDSVSFYLILLVLFLGVYSQINFFCYLDYSTRTFLFFSLFFSILCFCINHSILFWCFYELSMLPLLYLIFKESPYSERFLAGWYFACYLLVTSLPLVLVIFYLSLVNDTFFLNNWNFNVSVYIFLLISFIFFTKVPLLPFHTWLPIVHAEATSIVSIFLSGYIMKLGLLGVFRFSYFIFNVNFVYYLFACCFIAIFFFITASGELDGKRWLAFLSLSHIVVPFLTFFISDWGTINFSFFYCFGHGISAGLVFALLWYCYDSCNSRNWILLKSCINYKFSMLLFIFSLLSLCSFPPTIQFFCEICLIQASSSLFVYIIFWSLYLFFGGLVPLVLCGSLLIRSEYSENKIYSGVCFIYFFIYMCFWCYFGVFLI